METPPLLENEAERLDRLYQLDVLDTSAEKLYDDLTRLAAILCKTRFATVSLIDRDRQWFKSRQGGLPDQLDRDTSFCGHAILRDDVFIVEDAASDRRFADNPLVTQEPLIRFYAGAPLVTSDGFAIGTLCVFDSKPGTLSPEQREALELLANQVTERLEKRVEYTLTRHIGDILDTSDLYVLLLDLRRDKVLYTNDALYRRLPALPASATAAFQWLFPKIPLPDIDNDPNTEHTLEARVRFSAEDNMATWVRLIHSREAGRKNLMAIIHDQSALTASRKEAFEAHSRLRLFSQAANQSLNLIIITDADEHITWVNPSFEALTGYRLDEVIGKRPGDVMQGPDTSPEARRRLGEHIRNGLPVRQEILNYSRDGIPFWLDVYVEPIRNEQNKITHYVASQTDITRRKEQEQAIYQARDAAERANRGKSAFLANISHELRTPLNGILGVAELLQDKAPDNLQPMVQTLNQSSRHLLRLLNDLIDLSHIESGHMKLELAPINLTEELQEVANLFRPRAAEVGTELVLDIDGLNGSWLMGDATRIKQVVMNLVGNAVKFTENGKVLIQATASEANERFCTVELAVVDDGPGIPEADQQRIFEHFEQLDNSATRAYGGSGLGLAISRQLLYLMGAELGLESQPGQGARFHTRLVLAVTAAPGPSDSREKPAATSNPLREVLVVDDNAVNRNILETMLKHVGAKRTYTAGSARRGLAMLDNITPDLVFVDIQMPGMDGYQFLREARHRLDEANRPQPLMIACTAHSGDENKRRSLESGFNAHMEKPITRDALRTLLTSLSYRLTGDLRAPSEKSPYTPEHNYTVDAILNAGPMEAAFGDDESSKREFLELFLQHCPGQIAALSEALREASLPPQADLAHTLKGLLGYFGAPSLSAQAFALEQAMKADNLAQSIFCLARLKEELDLFIPVLEQAASHLSQ